MARNIKVGKKREDVAVKELLKKGYKILEKNYRNKHGETDIIVRKNKTIVFVEVRTVTGILFGSPEESVDNDKKERLIKNAEAYISKNNINKPYRIDLFCVVLDKKMNVKRKTHYKNITF